MNRGFIEHTLFSGKIDKGEEDFILFLTFASCGSSVYERID
jgi:hypothetical protein